MVVPVCEPPPPITSVPVSSSSVPLWLKPLTARVCEPAPVLRSVPALSKLLAMDWASGVAELPASSTVPPAALTSRPVVPMPSVMRSSPSIVNVPVLTQLRPPPTSKE